MEQWIMGVKQSSLMIISDSEQWRLENVKNAAELMVCQSEPKQWVTASVSDQSPKCAAV